MKRHDIALWSGVSAFCGNLLGLKVLDLISSYEWVQLLSAVIFSLLVAGLAYARERLREAKRHDVGPEANLPK